MTEKYQTAEIHEECGVFGVWGVPDAASLVYYGLHALQHRGQEGCGIVAVNDEGYLKRIIIPEGMVTNVGDVTYKDDEIIGYDLTISAYPHAEYENDTHREFIEAGE